jgi:hypothetical protein
MLRFILLVLFVLVAGRVGAQAGFPHGQAHAHNDYEHNRPLWDALQVGFVSVEADVHLVKGKLLVSHNSPGPGAKTLSQLYLAPLDSMIQRASKIYPGSTSPFYLMIDCKTEAVATYQAIQQALTLYPNLAGSSAVIIFLSGNRPVATMIQAGFRGIALDGRPEDLGNGISPELMPVVSDNFNKWSTWSGRSAPSADELNRVRALAQQVHAEGKKLRLWAIPDHELAWAVLLDAGVDLISTDRLQELHEFLLKRER